VLLHDGPARLGAFLGNISCSVGCVAVQRRRSDDDAALGLVVCWLRVRGQTTATQARWLRAEPAGWGDRPTTMLGYRSACVASHVASSVAVAADECRGQSRFLENALN
jgi:hypothetical protein